MMFNIFSASGVRTGALSLCLSLHEKATMLPTSSPELRRRSTTTTAGSSPAVPLRTGGGGGGGGGGGTPAKRHDPWSSQIVVDSRPLISGVGTSHQSHNSSLRVSMTTTSSSWSSFIRRPRFQALLCLCLTVLPWIYHSSQTHKVHSIHRTLSRLLREHKYLLASLELSQLELNKAQTSAQEIELDNRELVEALAAAAHELHQDSVQHHDLAEEGEMHVDEDGSVGRSGYGRIYQEAQHLEDLYLERIGIIEAAIRNHSLQHIREVYRSRTGGSGGGRDYAEYDGPMYVEMRLSAEGDGNAKDSPSRHHSVLLLETAPIHVAPHAIDHFLRLVDSQYYDGRTFALLHQPTLSTPTTSAAAHPLADPAVPPVHRIHTVERQVQPNGESINSPVRTEDKREAEEETSRTLLSMAFTDHHRGLYPLQKYSVLFHGKPGGGPHFSIHMMDPKRKQQTQQPPPEGGGGGDGHDEEEEWEGDDTADDACFARVVRGQDVLDRMVEMSRSTQRQQRVVLERVKVVGAPVRSAAARA